jgi:hypothetical protein
MRCSEGHWNLYSWQNVVLTNSRRIRCMMHVARTGEKRNMYTVLVEKPEVKIPQGSHGHRWDDNIKMDLEEIRWESVGCIYLAHNWDK